MGIKNYQKDIWAAITGNDPNKMKMYMNGRQIGKSVMSQMWDQNFILGEFGDYYSVIDKAIVDHTNWYTVKCSGNISDWVKKQEKELWYEHIDKNWQVYRNTFDIHEKIYILLQLKYGDIKI